MLSSEGFVSLSANEQGILSEREENIQYLKNKHQKYRKEDTARWIDAEPIKPPRVL